jgi:hypothetical protein
MKLKRMSLLVGFALALASCRDGPTAVPAAPSVSQGAARGMSGYIVRFRDDIGDASGHVDRLAAAHGGRVTHKYNAAIKGFAAEFSDREIAALARDPAVLAIEPDRVVYAVVTQPYPPSWGLVS